MADDDRESVPVDAREDEIASAKGIMGNDTFKKKDPRDTIWPEKSEGAGVISRLRRGYTPSDIVKEFRGERAGDIELPPSTRGQLPLQGKMDSRNPRFKNK